MGRRGVKRGGGVIVGGEGGDSGWRGGIAGGEGG